jgi:hypothetical protein
MNCALLFTCHVCIWCDVHISVKLGYPHCHQLKFMKRVCHVKCVWQLSYRLVII